MKKQHYKIGQKIQAYIDYANEIVEGTIIAISEHKGRLAYSLDNHRFVYHSQVWGSYE